MQMRYLCFALTLLHLAAFYSQHASALELDPLPRTHCEAMVPGEPLSFNIGSSSALINVPQAWVVEHLEGGRLDLLVPIDSNTCYWVTVTGKEVVQFDFDSARISSVELRRALAYAEQNWPTLEANAQFKRLTPTYEVTNIYTDADIHWMGYFTALHTGHLGSGPLEVISFVGERGSPNTFALRGIWDGDDPKGKKECEITTVGSSFVATHPIGSTDLSGAYTQVKEAVVHLEGMMVDCKEGTCKNSASPMTFKLSTTNVSIPKLYYKNYFGRFYDEITHSSVNAEAVYVPRRRSFEPINGRSWIYAELGEGPDLAQALEVTWTMEELAPEYRFASLPEISCSFAPRGENEFRANYRCRGMMTFRDRIEVKFYLYSDRNLRLNKVQFLRDFELFLEEIILVE